MFEYKIENSIADILSGDSQKYAFEFTSFLKDNEVLFERGKGYWEDKHYWMVKYKNQYICFILIGSEDKIEHNSWIIWSDDSDSNWFSDILLNEQLKETAWKNIDFCGNCGGCKNRNGTNKKIFGKEFNNVCITTFRFINPDIKTLECIKELVKIRKNDIQRKENIQNI